MADEPELPPHVGETVNYESPGGARVSLLLGMESGDRGEPSTLVRRQRPLQRILGADRTNSLDKPPKLTKCPQSRMRSGSRRQF
jgi:hypothetical protein